MSTLKVWVLACSQRTSAASESLALLQVGFVVFLASIHRVLRNTLKFSVDKALVRRQQDDFDGLFLSRVLFRGGQVEGFCIQVVAVALHGQRIITRGDQEEVRKKKIIKDFVRFSRNNL